MAVSQSLSVTEVAGSTNAAANTSMVAIIWDSTQTGDSWNGYTKTAKYYISINGGPETEYTVSYTLPKNATQRILSKTITVTHKDDGSGSVKVRTWMDTGISAGVVEKSKTIDLRTIPRASTITTIANKSLGNSCIVAWTPLSSTYRYKLQFSLKGWLHTTDVIHPNQTTVYNYILTPLPLEVANQFSADSKEGTLEVRLFTYSDSAATTQVGSTSKKTFTVTLPDNESTKPTVTMSLAPVHSLSSKFASVYVQGKSKVQATLSTTGKYNATVPSKWMTALNKTDGASPYETDILIKSGTTEIIGYATDSRGFTGSTKQNVTVIPYSRPKIIPASGEESIICARCDENGNLSDSGTYLKIKAKRDYSKVESGSQLNFCAIRYRCKPASNASFTDSDWVTILAKNSTSDEISTGPIANVVPNASISYIVEVGVVDDVGESSSLKIIVPTSSVDFHLRKGGSGAAFGKYAESEKCLEVSPDWSVKILGGLEVGGISAYVVEQGESGIWSYRKWSNGFAECWGCIQEAKKFNSSWGSLYVCSTTSAINYPFEFVERPTEIATARTRLYDCWLVAKGTGDVINSATYSGRYFAVRPTQVDDEFTLYIDLIVKGRWK